MCPVLEKLLVLILTVFAELEKGVREARDLLCVKKRGSILFSGYRHYFNKIVESVVLENISTSQNSELKKASSCTL